MASPKQNAIYQNLRKLKPEVAVVIEKREYLTLEKPIIMGWRTVNIDIKETKNLKLVRDMTKMRYIGRMNSQIEEGINIVNENTWLATVKFGADS